jgi:hypothetical protein
MCHVSGDQGTLGGQGPSGSAAEPRQAVLCVFQAFETNQGLSLSGFSESVAWAPWVWRDLRTPGALGLEEPAGSQVPRPWTLAAPPPPAWPAG